MRGDNDDKYVEDDEVYDNWYFHMLDLKIRVLRKDVRFRITEVDGCL